VQAVSHPLSGTKPPSISGDSIRPVVEHTASAVIGYEASDLYGQCASQKNAETPKLQASKVILAREEVHGSNPAHELGEIIPRPRISQEDLDAAQPRSRLRIIALMTAPIVSNIQLWSYLIPCYSLSKNRIYTYICCLPIPGVAFHRLIHLILCKLGYNLHHGLESNYCSNRDSHNIISIAFCCRLCMDVSLYIPSF
jgi:hypothetical protein